MSEHNAKFDAIIKADDRQSIRESVPEWGIDVLIGVMSGTARGEFDEMLAKVHKEGMTNIGHLRVNLLVRTLLNEDGTRIFTNDHADILAAKSSLVIDRLYDIADGLNKIRGEKIEALEGKSESAPS